MIPVSAVEVGPAEEELVLEVLRSGRLTQGPMVERLEQEFAPVAGTAHAVAVNNGTTALIAALQVLGIGAGDEVVTSPFTFVATVNAALTVGATVQFADIGPDFTVDPSDLAVRVTDRTRAVLPVHLYGQPTDMPAIETALAGRDIAIVEDAAQAHGASVGGRPAGSFGVGCFSLYATKNLMAGEGGLITTDDDQLADRLRVLRNQGMRDRYDYETVGQNYRLSDLHAALAVAQLATLTERTEQRRRNASRLIDGLAGVEGLLLPREEPGRRHVWHQFTVRVTPSARTARDAVVAELNAGGVGTGIYYPRAIPDYAVYAEHPRVLDADIPNARRAAAEVISLPVHHRLRDDDIDHIIEVVRKVLDG